MFTKRGNLGKFCILRAAAAETLTKLRDLLDRGLQRQKLAECRESRVNVNLKFKERSNSAGSFYELTTFSLDVRSRQLETPEFFFRNWVKFWPRKKGTINIVTKQLPTLAIRVPNNFHVVRKVESIKNHEIEKNLKVHPKNVTLIAARGQHLVQQGVVDSGRGSARAASSGTCSRSGGIYTTISYSRGNSPRQFEALYGPAITPHRRRRRGFFWTRVVGSSFACVPLFIVDASVYSSPSAHPRNNFITLYNVRK